MVALGEAAHGLAAGLRFRVQGMHANATGFVSCLFRGAMSNVMKFYGVTTCII